MHLLMLIFYFKLINDVLIMQQNVMILIQNLIQKYLDLIDHFIT